MTKPSAPAEAATVIPHFQTEAQERAYWESHDSSAHVDWSNAQTVVLPHLRPSTETSSLRLRDNVQLSWFAQTPKALLSKPRK